MLGYRGHADWRDMSEYVVHFTGAIDAGGARDRLLAILDQRQVRPSGPFGAARGLDALGDSQRSACFSEVPLDHLGRLTERRSSYGVGFSKTAVRQAGGARVWYLDHPDSVQQTVFNYVRRLTRPWRRGHEFWSLTPFIDYCGDINGVNHNFEWEREWRVPGGLNFAPDQVLFLFAPADDHGPLREEPVVAADYRHSVLIDSTWTDDELQARLTPLPF